MYGVSHLNYVHTGIEGIGDVPAFHRWVGGAEHSVHLFANFLVHANDYVGGGTKVSGELLWAVPANVYPDVSHGVSGCAGQG
jgi:hypothetical protein